jgi:Co/Zn/Cd efflux system component
MPIAQSPCGRKSVICKAPLSGVFPRKVRGPLLVRFRHHKGSLTRAAFLSARNDALANIAIIGAGLLILAWPSVWPDVLVGLGIAYMNVGAAREVWTAARSEH